jgi:hypothetical protein
MRLCGRGRVFSFPALLPQRGVLLLLRVNELLARIAMLAAGTPVAAALLLLRRATVWLGSWSVVPIPVVLGSLLAKGPAAATSVLSNPCSLRRLP